jgi:hypothetical protein
VLSNTYLVVALAAVVPIALALMVYGYYMIDTQSPDEDITITHYSDRYPRVHNQTKGAVHMNKQMIVVGKVVLGKRVPMSTPMVASSNRFSDVLRVEAVAPVLPVREHTTGDSDPWLYMRMVQQWKLAGVTHE